MALAAASRTFKSWSQQPAYARARILTTVAERLSADAETFAHTMTTEFGKPITESRGEVARVVELLQYAAEEAKRITGETIPLDALTNGVGRFGFTLREPIGVIAAITPFNFPLALVAHKIAPAIGVGNTVVLKPASTTPLTALRFAQLFLEAGLPPDVFNVVTAGGTTAEQLITDSRVAMVSFTGSAPVGERIRVLAGLKRVTLELGSNSATIVHSDADIQAAAVACSKAGYAFAGQVCISLQRIYAHREVLEAFLSKFVPLVQALRVGDPFEPHTDVGPMLTENEAKRAENWIHEATEARRTGHLWWDTSWSILDTNNSYKCSSTMCVVCEEVFAPIVSITAYDTFDEAITLVNESKFGLQAGIFTKDIGCAFKAAKEINVGGVIINDTCRYRADHMPYGGVKQSGIGREGVKYAMDEMTETKVVGFNLNP